MVDHGPRGCYTRMTNKEDKGMIAVRLPKDVESRLAAFGREGLSGRKIPRCKGTARERWNSRSGQGISERHSFWNSFS